METTAAITIVAALCGWSLSQAQVLVKGRVIADGKENDGIYFVKVEIKHGKRDLGKTWTDPDGTFSLELRDQPPLKGLVVIYDMPGYLHMPQKVNFDIPAQPAGAYSLTQVSLISEAADASNLLTIADSVFNSKKKNNSNYEAILGHSSIFGLTGNSKALVFDRIRLLDPGLYASVQKADEAAKTADYWQRQLPNAEVTPDFTFKNAAMVDGVPKKNSELVYLERNAIPRLENDSLR